MPPFGARSTAKHSSNWSGSMRGWWKNSRDTWKLVDRYEYGGLNKCNLNLAGTRPEVDETPGQPEMPLSGCGILGMGVNWDTCRVSRLSYHCFAAKLLDEKRRWRRRCCCCFLFLAYDVTRPKTRISGWLDRTFSSTIACLSRLRSIKHSTWHALIRNEQQRTLFYLRPNVTQ